MTHSPSKRTGTSWLTVGVALAGSLTALAIGLLATTSVQAVTVPRGEPEIPPELRQALEEIDWQRYQVSPQPVQYGYGLAAPGDLKGISRFQRRYPGERRIEVDERLNVPLLIEGEGIPVLPGSGNNLQSAAFGIEIPSAKRPTLMQVAELAGAFLRENGDLLGVSTENLLFNEKTSKGFGRGNRYWSLRFQGVLQDPAIGPIPIRDAFVFFRISHGNLIQFGNRLVTTPVGIDTGGILTRQEAVERALDLLDHPQKAKMLEAVVDIGQADRTLQVVPTNSPDSSLGHQLVRTIWVRTDRFNYELWFDAHGGELVYAIDRTSSTDASVRAGIYPVTNTGVGIDGTEVLRGMPFLEVINDGVTKTTSKAGVYDYAPPASLATASLEGPYVRIVDSCGSSSLSTSLSPGDLSFGRGAGTDCEIPGFGGPGNTHAARSSYYHLNLIKEKARTYLGVAESDVHWLNDQLESRTNLSADCNAYWDPPLVKFYQEFDLTSAGEGQCPTDPTVDWICSNTGEIAGIFLHEFGHGLDDNTNGAPPEKGTGEAYGDIMAFLQTHDGCIGNNFFQNCPCRFGCGVNCTGVRDVSVTPSISPATIENAPADCDRWACPYLYSGIWPYQGPMGYEGHCESLIASGAFWDMAQSFVGRYDPGAGWALADRIWYESLNDTGSAYQVVSGGTCNTGATVDGCGPDNWYTVFLALDDDNGNLADGTPNADLIWNAFNDHGIACGAAAPPVNSTCPDLDAPTLTATASAGQVDLSWTAVTGAAEYVVYRNAFGCDQGFTPITTLTAPSAAYLDTDVTNGTEYFYAVQAVGTNDICVSEFSLCQSATPTSPLVPADIFMVLDESGSMGGTTDVAGEQKIDALHDAALMVVDLVEDYASDGFELGGVSFSTAVTGTESLKDLSDAAQKTVLETFITNLSPTNLTAIGLGINETLATFPAGGTDQKVVMLLSDGIQNVSPYLELNAPPPGASVGGTPLPGDVRFYTVALGTSIQEDLFDDLANQGGIPGFYFSGGTAEIQGNFAFWIADVLGLDPSGAPLALSPPGGGSGLVATSGSVGPHSTVFRVNRTVRRVTFLLSWAAKGSSLRFYLDTPVGRIDPPPTSFHDDKGYGAYTVRFPLPKRGAEDHVGDWSMVVTGPHGAPPNVTFRPFALFDDPALRLDYAAGGPDPGAGEALPLEARILENGSPLSGVDVSVRVVGPEDGLGEILSGTSASARRVSATGSPGDRYPDPASQKLALLLEQSPELFQKALPNAVPLTEVAPGLYQGQLTGERVVAAGTYVFDFEVGGTGIVNDSFRRNQRFSRYLRLKPVPENTVIVGRVATDTDVPAVDLVITPRDRFSKRLGPGWGGYISVKASVGRGMLGVPLDNLDGSYTVRIHRPDGTDPRVSVRVRGETVIEDRLSTLVTSKGRRLEAGPFIGWSYMDSKLPLDGGPILGGRWALDFNPSIAFESELAVIFSDDSEGVEGVVLQIGQSVVYHLAVQNPKVRPFFVGGLGALAAVGFSRDDASLAVNLGGGVKLDLGSSLQGRIEVRDWIADDLYGVGTSHNWQVTLGISASLP